MANRLLPPPDDFSYQGSRAGLWLFGLLMAVKAAIALGAIFNGHYAATVADGIPVDSYTKQGALAFVSVFASLGLCQLLLSALGLVILLRYQALVPLMLLFLVLEFLGKKAIAHCLPIERTTSPAGDMISWVMFAIMGIALAISVLETSGGSEF